MWTKSVTETPTQPLTHAPTQLANLKHWEPQLPLKYMLYMCGWCSVTFPQPH